MTTAITRTRQAPWLGCGTTGEWRNFEDALHYGGLDYLVEQVDAWDDRGNRVPGILVNRNTTTHEIVGVTSQQYGVVQNFDAFSLLEPFTKSGGIIEHAGMTAQGMCFMVMRVPSMAFGFQGDDFDFYVCAMNSFNTRFPLALIITPIRVYCQNMFRNLLKQGDSLLVIKHGRFANDRILSVSKANELMLGYQNGFVHQLTSAATTIITQQRLNNFVEHMLPMVEESPKKPRAKQTNERIEMLRQEFIDDYYHAPDNIKYEGTSLGILNAYYDWTSHHEPIRNTANYNDTRFSNLLSGTGVSRKLIELA